MFLPVIVLEGFSYHPWRPGWERDAEEGVTHEIVVSGPLLFPDAPSLRSLHPLPIPRKSASLKHQRSLLCSPGSQMEAGKTQAGAESRMSFTITVSGLSWWAYSTDGHSPLVHFLHPQRVL